jgi:hypothetical protein
MVCLQHSPTSVGIEAYFPYPGYYSCHAVSFRCIFPFFVSVPSLWKDSLSLENIANDFLESNVTGEVMNLDDFLKELQVRKAEPMVVMTAFCYKNLTQQVINLDEVYKEGRFGQRDL